MKQLYDKEKVLNTVYWFECAYCGCKTLVCDTFEEAYNRWHEGYR